MFLPRLIAKRLQRLLETFLSGIDALRSTYRNLRFAPGLVIAPTAQWLPLSSHDYALPWDRA